MALIRIYSQLIQWESGIGDILPVSDLAKGTRALDLTTDVKSQWDGALWQPGWFTDQQLTDHEADKSNPHEVDYSELIGAQPAPITHSHTEAEITDLDKYAKGDFITVSVGSADAGKPIVLDSTGGLDPTISGSGLYPVAMYTPEAAAEYPDPTGEQHGAYWGVLVDAAGYTFVAGDLIGLTVHENDSVIYGSQGWGIFYAPAAPDDYYRLDGSKAITAPFAGGGQQVKNIAAATVAGDAVEFSQISAFSDGFVSTAGDTMSGNLVVNKGDITKITLSDVSLMIDPVAGGPPVVYSKDGIVSGGNDVLAFDIGGFTAIGGPVVGGQGFTIHPTTNFVVPPESVTPTASDHLATKGYIDGIVPTNYVKDTGDTMTGDLSIGSNSGIAGQLNLINGTGNPGVNIWGGYANQVGRIFVGTDNELILTHYNDGATEETELTIANGNASLTSAEDVAAVPTHATHITPKAYVDTQVGTKEDDLGFPASTGQLLSSDISGVRTWINAPNTGIPEAPVDGVIYGRGGATPAWVGVLPLTGGDLTGPLTVDTASGGYSIFVGSTSAPTIAFTESGTNVGLVSSQAAVPFRVRNGASFELFRIDDDNTATFASTVSGEVPTADEHFATKLYVDSKPGTPVGGATWDVLRKTSSTDHATEWAAAIGVFVIVLTWAELVAAQGAGTVKKWDKYEISDQSGREIEIKLQSPDGSSWFEEINDGGTVSLLKVE